MDKILMDIIKAEIMVRNYTICCMIEDICVQIYNYASLLSNCCCSICPLIREYRDPMLHYMSAEDIIVNELILLTKYSNCDENNVYNKSTLFNRCGTSFHEY